MTTAAVQTSAENGSIRIRLSGEVGLANVATVEEEIINSVPDQATAVSVDLTDLTYMDSAGVSILFSLATQLQKLQITLELIVPLDSPTRRLIELSGFESLATLRPATNEI
ncbi:MAG: STAS domain-containing protein [Actinomycetota bacterium]|nr:STAS domain-containing protein [Actinomycetota bacterium]